jgi:LPXTG-site transpeptidase (sortase) family protein
MAARNAPTTQFELVLAKKWSFFAIFVLVFVATYGSLATLNVEPNGPSISEVRADTIGGPVSGAGAVVPSEFPNKITIPKLNLETRVANPTTAAPAVLDAELLKGAVRYPTSGLLGTTGSNVVIFAHSSYLPIVHNQAYKAFDGIQNLVQGDKIYVTGTNRIYVYAVETVAQADAKKAGIPLSVEGNKLTLITCDSFATKSDRFVVIAALVESYPIAK